MSASGERGAPARADMNVGAALITDLGHLNRDGTGVIMAKVRLLSSGGCNEELVEGFGGVA
jgi:hypothetical protein